MKTPQISGRQKLTLSPKLATALGAAVVATQADAALVQAHLDPLWGSNPQASDTDSASNIWDTVTFTIPLTVGSTVLTLEHRYFYSFFSSTFSSSTTSISRVGKVTGGPSVTLASAQRGAGAFTVNAAMFASAPASVTKGTYSSSSYNYGNAVAGADNFIPVKFNLGGSDLYGLAQVEFNESVGTGYVELLGFWYSDNGSPIKFDNFDVTEISAIPEVGGMIPTALLLGIAAFVRSRRKDPLAGSLAALAAGVGGLMACAHEEAN